MKNEIRVNRIYNAGTSEIRALDLGIGTDMTVILNSGSPYNMVLRDAERLAVMIDCELYVNDVRVRETIGD